MAPLVIIISQLLLLQIHRSFPIGSFFKSWNGSIPAKNVTWLLRVIRNTSQRNQSDRLEIHNIYSGTYRNVHNSFVTRSVEEDALVIRVARNVAHALFSVAIQSERPIHYHHTDTIIHRIAHILYLYRQCIAVAQEKKSNRILVRERNRDNCSVLRRCEQNTRFVVPYLHRPYMCW